MTSDSPGSNNLKCPRCGHINRVGMYYCEQCGTNLQTGDSSPLPTAPMDEEEAGSLTIAEVDADAVAQMRAKGMQAAADRAETGGDPFESGMLLVLDMEAAEDILALRPDPGDEITLGRRDPEAGLKLAVDLAPYGAYPLGVSRMHAVIHFAGDHLEIEDMGSANGTFLNGMRLPPNSPYPLRDGDHIRLARLNFHVRLKT